MASEFEVDAQGNPIVDTLQTVRSGFYLIDVPLLTQSTERSEHLEVLMKNPKFQIYVGEDNQLYFRVFAVNGEIILSSEGYQSKSGCENGMRSVKQNATTDERYQRKTASDGQYYFVLVAANNEPIGNSEMYSSEQARDNGIEAVKKTAPTAPVEDTS